MKIVVFGGPSLGSLPLEDENELIWLPPAGQCHVMSAVHRLQPDGVLLVDMLAWPDISVLHKELLWALSKGVRIVGTGGGGALRAAELSHCGMKGVGWVFDRVADGSLEDDTEVFCCWEKTGAHYRKTTVPLVNVRATLEDPAAAACMAPPEAEAFLKAAQNIHYKRRTPSAMEEALLEGSFSRERAEYLMNCFNRHYRDIQAEDARAAVEKIMAPGFLPASKTPESMPVPMDDQGMIFRMLYDNDRIVEKGGKRLRLYEIGNYATAHHPDMEAIAYDAFNRELVLLLANQTGIEADAGEVREAEDRFRRVSGLEAEECFCTWLSENDLSRDDFNALMTEEARIRKLQAAFLDGQIFLKNTRIILNYLRLTHDYTAWRNRAFDREEQLAGREDALKSEYMTTDFSDLLMERHSVNPLPWKDKVHPAADAVGIGVRELKVELLKDRMRERILLEKVEASLG